MGFGYFYGIDMTYIVLVLPAVVFALIMQSRVASVFSKYSAYGISPGMTGAEVARRMLSAFGIYDVAIERVQGNLTDHFDPKKKVIRLSDSVYDSASVAAAGVAAHECGHAMQYQVGYGPIKLRNAIIPACRIGSSLSVPMILLGFLFSTQYLVNLGIVFFALATVFQLITLPVEFNASRRALVTLESSHILSEKENAAAKKVLSAAAMTYVAALAVSLMQLLRLILIFGGRGRRNN
ncbi:MAG: zinc metallopeptidase [Oscillospiraceae bacterium]|nr:zinc metallopeptidase [Oscillospiraceae bacterium]